MSEPMRLGWEMTSLMMTYPMLASVPRGDGHPVMVLPGFATSDQQTMLLRIFLSQWGYEVHPLDLGWNFDHHTVGENGEHVARRIADIRASSGRKVSLVGWSLGGVIAREAARRDPDDIRQVISLGSPFTGNPHATNLANIYQKVTGNDFTSDKSKARYAEGSDPLPVPSTAIYSRTDGITAWRNCLGQTDAINENVEVISSHFGFVVNPAVFYAVADRLAQTEGGWRKFVPEGAFRHCFA
ncbi:MAG: alpha/beta fold hydrolase [Sphingomonadaceae bacterium]|nr:alpha/beta fold hydrolase [Sphingomonadaceae bacterium]